MTCAALRPVPVLLLTVHLALGLPGRATAQVATGRVTDESTGEPVVGAMISLLDGSRDVVERVVSGPEGQYAISAPEAGAFWLTADFLVYQRLESPRLAMEDARTVRVDFELPVDPIELEGLAVEAERNEELRQRLRMWGVRPDGMPGVCVSIRGGGCALVVWNGQPVSEVTAGSIPPMSLGAIVLLRPQEATLVYGTDGGNGAVLLFTQGMSGNR